MCGITGILARNDNGKSSFDNIKKAVDSLNFRGPDNAGIFSDDKIALGHARLSIIDTSENANQPLEDSSKRYVITFNGEFYNFKEHRSVLESKGYSFNSDSDTEVLLNMYIDEGISFLNKINGFFSVAIYDKQEKSLFIARDRIGIKPLYFYEDDNQFIWGSEMKSILAYDIPKEINQTSLYTYLQLNYIPGPNTILKNVRKIVPGNYMTIKDGEITEDNYYKIPYNPNTNGAKVKSYDDAKKDIKNLIDESVKKRLVSDVPLGAFLSGGIDSSVIVAMASRYKKDLSTFSIGYKDEAYFDETNYANLVADKFNTNHTVFKLSNDDIFEDIYNVLDYIDEPFADSSAIAVYILSKKVRKHIKVVLSGDGADELFSGYNKHMAEYKVRNAGLVENIIKVTYPLWKILPKSRGSFVGNKIRQFERFSSGMNLTEKERYWKWCSLVDEDTAKRIIDNNYDAEKYLSIKENITKHLTNKSINDVLYTDMHLVLQNDMLTKVDSMSMANSLEVRVPFLDHDLVDYVFSLPESYKIDNLMKKKILQDAYCSILPRELYKRPKRGFEVPLLNYLRTEFKKVISNDLLSDDFIEEQGIFNLEEIKNIKKKLFSADPGDIHALVWGLIVFQYWWKKYLN